jgi:transcription elongation factor Elf1
MGKTAMKNHILKEHAADGEDECILVRIEGAYDKDYWLFADIHKDKTLNSLDTFMRNIWLECCGHLSHFKDGFYSNIGKTRKMGGFSAGDKFIHEYDMGSTTECIITIMGETKRNKQKNAVRLLARNVPPAFDCAACGEPAESICQQCMYDTDNPFYCAVCAGGHEHDMMKKITNSPRCGECGYDGELDVYEFKGK